MDKADLLRHFVARVPRAQGRSAKPTTLTAVQAGRASPQKPAQAASAADVAATPSIENAAGEPAAAAEFGGPSGPEPTRFGDWERNGRCSDF